MIIKIPGFKGGIGDSLYDALGRQTFQSAQDLAVYDDTEVLTPTLPAFTDIAYPTQYTSPADMTAVNFINYIKASDGGNYFLGQGTVSASNYIILYKAGDLSASPTWTKIYGDTGSYNAFGGIVDYKGSLLFGKSQLLKSTLLSTAVTTTAGTLANGSESFGDIISHKGLGRAFFAHGLNSIYTKVGHYDGSTFTEGVLNLGLGMNIVNLDQSGRFVLVGIRPEGNSQKSYIGVWDGISATLDDIIEIGDYGLQGFRNRGGKIEAVTINVPATASQSFQRIYRGSLGSDMQLYRELKGLSTGSSIYANAITASGSGLYIGFGSSGIYALNSKNKNIPDFLSDWRSLSVTAEDAGNVTIRSIRETGGTMVVNWVDTTSGTVYKTSTTGGAQAMPSTGVYESEIFPINNGLPGMIKKIFINHKAIPTSCGFTVQIKLFGTYAWGTSVPSAPAYQDLVGPQGSGSSTGKTQSTNNAIFTDIQSSLFVSAKYAQIKISFDEISTTTAPSIIFPILVDVDQPLLLE